MQPSIPDRLGERLAPYPAVLMEGAVIERLKRETDLALDPLLLNAPLIYDAAGRTAMTAIYASYLAIATDHRLPMLVAAPTWRANAERAGSCAGGDVVRLNRDAVEFLRRIVDGRNAGQSPVLVGGLMACRGDAYDPAAALSARDAEAFHGPQASALADAGADYIMAATLPALSEATGMAARLSGLSVPYIISFVLGRDGALLDGTDLAAAIHAIDDGVSRPPAFYMVNCVHPQTLSKCLGDPPGGGAPFDGRLMGIQANTSERPPDELDGRATLDGADPGPFADLLTDLNRRYGLKIIGGCCGTDERHIDAVARRLSREDMPR